MIKTTALKKPKSPVKPPRTAVLVRVKYMNKAPIIMRRSPKNFSASDTQKVSPSLMLVYSFHFLMLFKNKTTTVILYFRLHILFVEGLTWLDILLTVTKSPFPTTAVVIIRLGNTSKRTALLNKR